MESEQKELPQPQPIEAVEDNQKTIVDEAREAAAEIKKQKEEFAKLLDEQKKILVRQELGGTTNAGIPKEKPKEETPQEYAQRILRGDLNRKTE